MHSRTARTSDLLGHTSVTGARSTHSHLHFVFTFIFSAFGIQLLPTAMMATAPWSCVATVERKVLTQCTTIQCSTMHTCHDGLCGLLSSMADGDHTANCWFLYSSWSPHGRRGFASCKLPARCNAHAHAIVSAALPVSSTRECCRSAINITSTGNAGGVQLACEGYLVSCLPVWQAARATNSHSHSIAWGQGLVLPEPAVGTTHMAASHPWQAAHGHSPQWTLGFLMWCA